MATVSRERRALGIARTGLSQEQAERRERRFRLAGAWAIWWFLFQGAVGLAWDIRWHTTFGRDSDRTYQLCELGGARLRGSCYVGAILNFIDVTWTLDQALTFCQRVPNEYKAQCYAGIGGQIAALHTEQETRARECARVEAGYQDACTNAALGRQ